MSLAARMDDALRDGPRQAITTRIAIREIGRVYFVGTASVDWIEGADYYVKLHVGPKVHMLRESLTSLERRLDPDRFCRIHRSAIVNLDRVREIRPESHGDQVLLLDDGTRLKLSRARRARFDRMMENLGG